MSTKKKKAEDEDDDVEGVVNDRPSCGVALLTSANSSSSSLLGSTPRSTLLTTNEDPAKTKMESLVVADLLTEKNKNSSAAGSSSPSSDDDEEGSCSSHEEFIAGSSSSSSEDDNFQDSGLQRRHFGARSNKSNRASAGSKSKKRIRPSASNVEGDASLSSSKCRWEGCQEQFDSPELARDHEQNVHILAGGTECKIKRCGKIYATAQKLQRHFVAHLERQFLCEQCGKKFLYSWDLKRHEFLHTGDRPFHCTEPGCARSFTKAVNLDAHLAHDHEPVPGKLIIRTKRRSTSSGESAGAAASPLNKKKVLAPQRLSPRAAHGPSSNFQASRSVSNPASPVAFELKQQQELKARRSSSSSLPVLPQSPLPTPPQMLSSSSPRHQQQQQHQQFMQLPSASSPYLGISSIPRPSQQMSLPGLTDPATMFRLNPFAIPSHPLLGSPGSAYNPYGHNLASSGQVRSLPYHTYSGVVPNVTQFHNPLNQFIAQSTGNSNIQTSVNNNVPSARPSLSVALDQPGVLPSQFQVPSSGGYYQHHPQIGQRGYPYL
jgi:hypothetical protein